MQKKMKIEGMSCDHCKAFVEKTLKAIDGVDDAVVSLEDKSAIITLSDGVSDEVLMQAVTDADYEPIEIFAI